MQDEAEFRPAATAAIETLKQHLVVREDEIDDGFEVAEQDGALNVIFSQTGDKLVIAPNAATRQIWISGLASSDKLDWDAASKKFVLPRSGEALIPLVDRLIDEHRVH